jgi:hypothetical protein
MTPVREAENKSGNTKNASRRVNDPGMGDNGIRAAFGSANMKLSRETFIPVPKQKFALRNLPQGSFRPFSRAKAKGEEKPEEELIGET